MAGVLSTIGFTTPWLLWSLILLPILWFLLRAVPPAPVRRRFPGVVLLLGLKDEDSVTDKTPWWLIALRMLAAAAVIIGLAGPVLNPNPVDQARRGPLLLVFDASWAGAPNWQQRLDVAQRMLADAGRQQRVAAVLTLSDPVAPVFQSATATQTQLAGLLPKAWAPSPKMVDSAIAMLADLPTGTDVVWVSDGLEYPGQAELTQALSDRGSLQVLQSTLPVVGLHPVAIDGNLMVLTLQRNAAVGPQRLTVRAHGQDPNGIERILASAETTFDPRALSAELTLSLPAELRARISRFDIEGLAHAGAVSLNDDSLRRREVALIAGRDDREGLELLSPLHYLHQALLPSADLLDGALPDVLPANPDVIVLADVGQMTSSEELDLIRWVEEGGLLVRFAGPRMAASDLARSEEHPLMPVRLRFGGRTVGGAMSWGAPKTLSPFSETSPFFGLNIPEDVTVTSQVLAQPDPSLAERVIAQLSDGTPLVTQKNLGLGRVVLVHVSANAEWSNLPLSGLFVRMLDRLAVSSVTALPEAEDLQGTVWQPQQVLDGSGRLRDGGTLAGVAGEDLLSAALSRDLQPGLYQGPTRRYARNVVGSDTELSPIVWPASVDVQGLIKPESVLLAGYLLALALILLAVDVLATLALSGRLLNRAAASVALVLAVAASGQEASAQSSPGQDDFAILATSEVVLAYVLTGNARVDDVSRAGLQGLSDTLYFRTSVEPALPVGVDLERDELAFFPLLYWPITEDQPIPSSQAYEQLNRYIRSGGMILFDTRDADVAGFGAATATGRKLRSLAEPLAIPALEPLPQDHVLTRTFYLLQDFPGRYAGRDIWVEAAPADAVQIEGMPFRNLNDGVTPVVIGGNDWAAAWATDAQGNSLYPVGRGFAGERQRELAFRFGVNLVMHVLTGNYKSDQVHVPALLDRLGQ